MNNLSCNCVERLDGVAAAQLRRLFPEPSITAPLLSLLTDSGMDGFNLRSIVVSRDDDPILLLPLFETRFDLSTFVKGRFKTLLKAAGRLIPSLFRPRILGVGLLVGEWSEIGIDPQIDADTLDEAFHMAFDALQILAVELKSDFVALYNFSQYSKLPEHVAKQFNRVPCQSCAQLPINFNNVEEFLARLSRAARKNLNRKMRTSNEVKIIRSRDISSFLDRIYKLYLETTARSPLMFGVLKPLFFEKICERIPDALYTLYFVQEELIAFNLLIVKPEAMVDKYFCMDYEVGRKYNLYALSWLENIRRCAELKIPIYQAGQGAESIKAHLGATFIPSFIFFRHRLPMIDRFILWLPVMNRGIARRVGFWPGASDVLDDREDLRPRKAQRNNFQNRYPIEEEMRSMANDNEHAIEVEELTKRYGDLLAVNDISFTVRKGEVFALLGPNGAGKTTTTEIIETIRTPTSGKVTLFGMDVTKRKHDIVGRIGVLPQGFSSFDRITVKETLQYYSRLFGCVNTDIDGLIELVDLKDKAKEQYRNLSGGLKQRLGIAIALVNDPEVVFLDEPTTGLDPRARREVWEILLGLKNKGKTIFLTTHYMEEAELLADKVAIISKGKIAAIGSPDELIKNNATHIVLTLQSLDEKPFEIVRKMGFAPVHENSKGIKVRLEHADDVQNILNAVKDAGVSLVSMDVRKPNLEEVFLKLTGEALGESTAGERRPE